MKVIKSLIDHNICILQSVKNSAYYVYCNSSGCRATPGGGSLVQ